MGTYNLLSSRASALEISSNQVCIVDFNTRRERFVEDGSGEGEKSGVELVARSGCTKLETYSP